MNIVVVTEDSKGGKQIYEKWIAFVNSNLSLVSSIDEIIDDNYTVIAGFGSPYYFEIIKGAIADINEVNNVDRLVIAVDSEDFTREEKLDEITRILDGIECSAEIIVIIQHFCIEAWLLGNRKVYSRSPSTERYQKYHRHFDLTINDPEEMPGCISGDIPRAKLAEAYLRAIFNEKYHNLTYTKSNATAVTNKAYFSQVRKRTEDTGHIDSFNLFLEAFE